MTRRLNKSRKTLRSQTSARSRLRGWVSPAAVLLALLAGGPASASAQTTATTSLPVTIADFNNDGIPDVLVPSATTPTATIAFGSVPYGNFNSVTRAVTFPAACASLTPGSVLVGDMNGDQVPDIVFFCGDVAGTAGVMLGKGDGTFAPPQLMTGVIAQLGVLGDFNKDGKLDLVAIGPATAADGSQSIQFYAGNGDGTFAAAVTTPFANGKQYTSPVAVDVDGDGYPDLVLGNFNSNGAPTLDVYGNNKSGTFGVVTSGSTSPSVSAAVGAGGSADATILVGSFFGAGTTDFAVTDTGSNPGFFVIRNTSTAGAFSLGAPAKTAVAGLVSGRAGSVTGSGFTDLVAANGTTVTALVNDGSGNFTASYTALQLASTASDFSVADANGDGYADVYTASIAAKNLQLAVNLVSGSATATSQPFSLGIGTKAVSATWPGDTSFTGSTAKGTQTVNGVGTNAGVTSTKNPSLVGDSVTFAVAIVPSIESTLVPTGQLVLKDGSATLATGTLDATGKYSYTTSALKQGTHTIQAVYAGDNYFAGSSSPLLSQIVNHAAPVTPTLTWATPAAITYGTALSATQLNATATDASGLTIPGTFLYTPAAGTLLHAGAQTLSVTFTPTDTQSFTTVMKTVSLTVLRATPTLTWAAPASIAYGIPLSATQLDASVTGLAGALPGVFTYNPPAGTVLNPGAHTLTVGFVPTDAVDYTGANGSVPLTVTGLTLTSFTPNTATLGDSNKTITLTGAGFVSTSVVLVNGSAVPTKLVSPTTLTAVIPASDFDAVGTLQIAVKDPTVPLVSVALPLTITAPLPAVTFGGPSTTQPGTQPSLTFTIQNPYPVPLTAVLTLGFPASVTPAVDDPAIQFAAGGRTLTFTIPANSTAVPAIQLQSGTVAGTITIPLMLTAGGANVTPTNLQPVVITIPPAVPAVSTAKLVRDGGQLSVVISGFSNTREITQANFHFVGANGATIDTPDVPAQVGPLFATWYATTESVQYGSTFTYTQMFNVSSNADKIGSVEVTLSNAIGKSAAETAQ